MRKKYDDIDGVDIGIPPSKRNRWLWIIGAAVLISSVLIVLGSWQAAATETFRVDPPTAVNGGCEATGFIEIPDGKGVTYYIDEAGAPPGLVEVEPGFYTVIAADEDEIVGTWELTVPTPRCDPAPSPTATKTPVVVPTTVPAGVDNSATSGNLGGASAWLLVALTLAAGAALLLGLRRQKFNS